MRERRRVLLALGAIAAALFVAGVFAAYLSRHETICPDGKPPKAQRDLGLGRIEYRCRDGRTVTK